MGERRLLSTGNIEESDQEEGVLLASIWACTWKGKAVLAQHRRDSKPVRILVPGPALRGGEFPITRAMQTEVRTSSKGFLLLRADELSCHLQF